MMRAIICTAVGFWMSRQVYERHELSQRKLEKEATKIKLKNYLISIGWNQAEIDSATLIIFEKNEQ